MYLRLALPRFAAASDDVAEEVLDARVDVGAVEGVKAQVDEAVEGGGRVLEIKGVLQRVARGKLPAAVDDAGNGIVGRELNAVHLRGVGHVHGVP